MKLAYFKIDDLEGCFDMADDSHGEEGTYYNWGRFGHRNAISTIIPGMNPHSFMEYVIIYAPRDNPQKGKAELYGFEANLFSNDYKGYKVNLKAEDIPIATDAIKNQNAKPLDILLDESVPAKINHMHQISGPPFAPKESPYRS